MTNAERQQRYRLRKAEAGLIRKDAWTNRAGLLAPIGADGGWSLMSPKEFERKLQKLFGFESDSWKRDAVYAELFEYAKSIKEDIEYAYKQGDITL